MNLFEEETQEDLRAKFHADRLRGIGASEISVILGISPFKNKYSLWLEKTGRVKPQDLSNNFAVQKGVTWEPVARALVEQNMGMKFEPNRMTKDPSKPFISCLNDGYNSEFRAVLEIKVGGKKLHENAANGIIEPWYLCQVHYEMLCANALIGYFASFNPTDKSLHLVTVHPDLEEQARLEAAATDFWINNVLADTPPELTDDLYISCIDPDFEASSEKYKQLKAEIKMKQEELDAIETHLHSFLGNSAGIKQNGLTISRIVRRGNVNYKDIPELKGVDLEKYRAPSSTYITIKGVKS